MACNSIAVTRVIARRDPGTRSPLTRIRPCQIIRAKGSQNLRVQGRTAMRRYSFATSRLLPVLASLAIAAAQNTGTIFGTVTDQSGAVIAGVKVELVDIDRHITTEGISQDNGEYVFTPVRVGQYELKASKTGFATVVLSNLSLEVQQRMRVDLKLPLGAVGQSVEVQGQTPL